MLETPVLMALISCTWRSQIVFYLQSCSLGASSRSWEEQPGTICTHWRVLPCSSFSTAWLGDGIPMLSLHFECNFGKPGSAVVLWVERCHFSIHLAASVPKPHRSRISPRALLLHQALLELAGGSESFGRHSCTKLSNSGTRLMLNISVRGCSFAEGLMFSPSILDG